MTPKPAATLVILRQSRTAMELLMLERPARGFFGGLWVFPGGGVEPIDDSPEALGAVALPRAASDASWRVAALRETVEEVGVAITDAGSTEMMVAEGADVFSACSDAGLVLGGTRLRLLSQWITPKEAPTRFDARFYVTVVEGDPELTPRPGEVVDAAWVTPGTALDRSADGTWKLVTPTLHHLEWLAGFDDADDVWAAAANTGGVRVEPMIEYDGSEVRIRLPAEAKLP